jgi:thiamine-phosphate diphosphorylase
VAAAASAGVDYVQVREPDLEAGPLAALVRSLVASAGATKVLVNDRLDVALAAGAAGVQLKEASFPPGEVRRLVPPGFVIGCSVHSPAGAKSRRSADFLVAGTVLPTASKPRADELGWEGLAAVVEAASGQPVLGIGGLDLRSMPKLSATGAAGLAAIGAFVPSPGEPLFEFVHNRVKALRFGFDSVRRLT